MVSTVMPRLNVVVASTRPGRVGPRIADWVIEMANDHGAFDVHRVDLAEIDLPLFNEPKHPRFGEYSHDHTRAWSALTAAADAFVFVMPEYNFGFTAPLKNAIDYLHHEWRYKPVGFVSYGGVAAGTRAVQMIKPVLTALKMTPVNEAVPIRLADVLEPDGTVMPTAAMKDGVLAMLDELRRVAAALAVLRDPA